MNISEHFDSIQDNWVCRCGCGQMIINVELVKMAEALRAYFNQPVDVHCVNRCAKHNSDVGGEKNSLHLKGLAMDFNIEGMNIEEQHKLMKYLYDTGEILTGGVGFYSWGNHIDVGNKRTWRG